jgi:hypothetical protein
MVAALCCTKVEQQHRLAARGAERGGQDMTRMLLTAGVALPVIYFANLLLGGLFNPEIGHMTSAPSEYGAVDANLYVVWSIGFVLVGLAAAAAAVGLLLGLRRTGAGLLTTLPAVLAMGCVAFAFVMNGVFPLPDPLHYAFNILLPGLLTPLLGALALWKARAPLTQIALLLAFAGVIAIFAMMSGAGDLVDETNIGLWVRIAAVVFFGSLALLSWTVLRKLPARGSAM